MRLPWTIASRHRAVAVADRRGLPSATDAARSFAIAATIIALAPPASAANQVNGIRLHDAPDSTRVVLDTRAESAYKLFTMRRPDRIVIDLEDTVAKNLRPPTFDSRVVKRVRHARRGRGNLRVVLDLRQPATAKDFALKPTPPYGHRLVIDLFPAAGSEPPPEKPRQTVAEAGKRLAVVAVDAGHGGEDPGAIGAGGVYEKRVVLAIAKAVKKDLDAMPGLTATLVRSGDYYVPLRQRMRIARAEGVRADLFVSIHADAFRLDRVSGASVYALSERGASSETARWLAASENRSDLIGGVSGSWVSLDEVEEPVAQVLMDLSMDRKMEASISLGEAVLGAMAGVAKLHKKRVEQAGFAVLKSPDVPSILVETGFLSNPTEAKRLATPAYQRLIAGAIADGIRSYLLRNPPPDTVLADMTDGGVLRYVIKRGDTLSEIAVRNRVSMRRLRAFNSIAGDRINVGQVLLIPSSEGGS